MSSLDTFNQLTDEIHRIQAGTDRASDSATKQISAEVESKMISITHATEEIKEKLLAHVKT
jgi:uncharacterized protein YdcH (DUF465 family)